MAKVAYVEIKIAQNSVVFFDALVNQMCKNDDYYKSDVIDYIDGNVTKNLHLTLFYGCNPKGKKLELLKKYVKTLSIKRLSLGDLFLINGYKNLYKVLCVKVIDNSELKKMSETIASFGYDDSVTHKEFIPHLTLAYLRSDFTLSSKISPGKKFVYTEPASLKWSF